MRDEISLKSKQCARVLRRDLTPAERRLWHALRDRRLQAVKFRRQAPLGSYIVDFLCISNKIVVEVDGSQHGENRRDQIRDAWLEREGYRVMRFWNHEVTFNQEGVLATIAAACGLP
jgi:very-short-patch-repair endonuclease